MAKNLGVADEVTKPLESTEQLALEFAGPASRRPTEDERNEAHEKLHEKRKNGIRERSNNTQQRNSGFLSWRMVGDIPQPRLSVECDGLGYLAKNWMERHKQWVSYAIVSTP